MDRRDKTNYYLDMAQVALERGTCLRRNFGAVIVKNDVIVSTGYNGAPRGDVYKRQCPNWQPAEPFKENRPMPQSCSNGSRIGTVPQS